MPVVVPHPAVSISVQDHVRVDRLRTQYLGLAQVWRTPVERVAGVLIRTRAVSIKRNGEARDSYSCCGHASCLQSCLEPRSSRARRTASP